MPCRSATIQESVVSYITVSGWPNDFCKLELCLCVDEFGEKCGIIICSWLECQICCDEQGRQGTESKQGHCSWQWSIIKDYLLDSPAGKTWTNFQSRKENERTRY